MAAVGGTRARHVDVGTRTGFATAAGTGRLQAVAQDMERFFAELTALTDLVNAGAPGLTAVQRLVELAQTDDGRGRRDSFAEYGSVRRPGDRRQRRGAVGRRPVRRPGRTAGGPDGQRRPGGRGRAGRHAGRMRRTTWRAPGCAGCSGRASSSTGRVVGTLHDATTRTTARPSPPSTAPSCFFAGLIKHLYVDGQGLPIYGEDPATGALADAIAVVGPDGTVRSWNEAAATVTGRPAATALGRPLPVSVPVLRSGAGAAAAGRAVAAGAGHGAAGHPRTGWSPCATSPRPTAGSRPATCSSR